MITVQGKRTTEIDTGELGRLIEGYQTVALDIGTGDGRFAYAWAAGNPDTFVIGLDPVREAMRELSARAQRKPARGGLPNLLYVVASIEQPPVELAGRANLIFVNLPWGSLMRGIIEADDAVLANLSRLAAADCRLRIILNTRVFDDPVPLDVLGLPEITAGYAQSILAPAYQRHGLQITSARFLTPEELLDLGTTWAKRLSHRTPPPSFLIEARKQPAT
jgi:16S rRNA (adenine(1408)-N(1))-methyltransferase